VLTRGQTRLVVLRQAIDRPFCIDCDHQSGRGVRLPVIKAADAFPERWDLESWVPDNDLVGVPVENLRE
jgi:hypothetical protein